MKSNWIRLILLLPLLSLAGCASIDLGGGPRKEYNSDTHQWEDVYPVITLSSDAKAKPVDISPKK